MCPYHTHGIQETINHALKRALMEQNLLGAAADVIALAGVHLTVSLFSFSLKKKVCHLATNLHLKNNP